MKNLFKIAFLALTVLIANTGFSQEQGTHNVNVPQFEELVKGGKGIVLDVRTPKEFAEGHIDGAININYYDPNFKAQVEQKIDKSKPVYIYCRSGGRSSKAMLIMKDSGYSTLYNLLGGIIAWDSAHK